MFSPCEICEPAEKPLCLCQDECHLKRRHCDNVGCFNNIKNHCNNLNIEVMKCKWYK
jgi:hypothetical protein